ncbi:hypothetical protein HanXRQr2_Chr13g0579611 [Helianthus annuus]|uniref:Uncharacterized protein n=1 Tax=Helianthus annuus TaxID=4232 RepID=A0A251SR06_HELAN|nr:hypothetical protein HanXRQr2_Chr13g0579611 [Helianthus annuus]KAJ0848467.1 hypothetical protein HanPSC8_Chr13g0557791 [Helianthus annuus]
MNSLSLMDPNQETIICYLSLLSLFDEEYKASDIPVLCFVVSWVCFSFKRLNKSST